MRKVKDWTFPILIVAVGVFLAFKNYTAGTFLIGWDSLHPEFNFPEAFNRIFSGVWRQEQGLGAVAAHSHMADWPRILFLFLESFIVPVSFLRYSYIFLCLILGPLGVYFFIKYTVRGVPLATSEEYLPVSIGAFLGALFYLLNLGTLQHFFVPFEMFTTQFAFLPWLFYSALRFLREGKKKNLIIFAVLTVLSSPQAYAATLFYAYLGALSIYVLIYRFKKGIVLILITILLNLYWILPNLYSIKNQSGVVVNSKINQLFSPEARLRSSDYSSINDALIYKNFLFNWRAFDFEKNQFEDLIGSWDERLFYVFAGISLLGLVISLFKRDKVGLCLFGVALYSLFFLTGNYFGPDVLAEALRMPFTKFSIALMFVFAYFFGHFFFRLGKIAFLGLIIGSVALIYSARPMFERGPISPIVKRELPKEYFELFRWFREKDGRVAALPLNTLWGWDYHSWKYEGSGFLTYGLSNPLLVRDFDRWSPYNELFYREVVHALYSGNKEVFGQVLQKYQVKYLLLDESVINAGGDERILFIPEIKQMISALGYMEVFREGSLGVYDTRSDTGNISAPIREFGSVLPVVSAPKDLIISESFGEGRGFSEGYNCDLKKLGNVYKEGTTYRAEGGGVSCDYFDYPELEHNKAYVLRIKGENKEGRSLKIYLQNWKTNRMDLEELLPEGEFDREFVIYPSDTPEESFPQGYSLNLETRSFGRIGSENVIEKIEFYEADSTRQVFADFTWRVNDLKIKNVRKYGTAVYKADIQGSGLIQLGQSFEKGWVAFRGVTLLDHVKVNGWANGWLVPPSIQSPVSSIYIIFWPQALEWGGLILSGIAVLTLIKLKLY